MRSFALTRKGRDHPENEDAFFADDARGIFAISDGVGSSRGAGTASALVVAELAAHAGAGLPAAFKAAARRLSAEGARDRANGAMAAGATMLLLRGEERLIGHVGDARCYLARAGSVVQLTRDHSVAWEQFEVGAITRDRVRGHPNQRLLTRTFSARKDFVVPELARDPLERGDAFLLVTDGIVKEVSEEALAAILRSRPCEDWPRALIEEARAASDDATVVAVAT